MIGRMRENLTMFVRIDARMWTFTPLGRVLFILSSLVSARQTCPHMPSHNEQVYVTHLHVYGAASAHRWHLCGITRYPDMAPLPFRVYSQLSRQRTNHICAPTTQSWSQTKGRHTDLEHLMQR